MIAEIAKDTKGCTWRHRLTKISLWLWLGAFVLSLLALLPVTVGADVNVEIGGFIKKFTDVQENMFKLRRTYSSRSIYSGLFGFGWCGSLELSLQLLPRHVLKRLNCDTKVLLFRSGAEQKWRSVAGDWRGKSTRAGGWLLMDPTGLRETYDAAGHLIKIARGERQLLGLSYSTGGLLQSAVTGEGLTLRFEVDAKTHHLVRIRDNLERWWQYSYLNDDLLSLQTSRAIAQTFSYDQFHNLLEIDYPDGSLEKITYDNKHDRVLSQQSRAGTLTTFDYQLGADQHSFKVRARRKQSGVVLFDKVFSFLFSQMAGGELQLRDLWIQENQAVKKFQLNRLTGMMHER